MNRTRTVVFGALMLALLFPSVQAPRVEKPTRTWSGLASSSSARRMSIRAQDT